MTRARTAVLLGVVGCVGLLGALAWSALCGSDSAERAWREGESIRARVELEQHASARAELVEALIEAFEEAVVGMGAFEPGPRLWARLQAELGSPGTPPEAVLAIYDAQREEPERGFRFLAQITATETESAGAGALPDTLRWSEFNAGLDADEAPEDAVWFSDEPGGPRLHRLRQYLAEFPESEEEDGEEDGDEDGEEVRDEDDEGEDEESEALAERFFLFHLATRLEAPKRVRLEVLCDMRAGRLTADLPIGIAHGSLARDAAAGPPAPLETPALDGRRPTPDPARRVRAFLAAPPGTSHAPLLLGLLSALAVIAGWFLLARPPPARARAPADLTGEAAHEMRTPLTVMRGKLEVALRRERDPDYYRRTLRECLDEVDGLEHLQEAILLLTRTERGDLAREPIDVRALVAAEVERVQEVSPERAVTLQAEGPGPVMVAGDPSLLARAVGNLLDNAASHSIAGGAIRTSIDVGGRDVRIAVEDDGPGIPAERHALVFERFFRGPDVGRRGIAGCGLGLPLVRRIAELHAGSVAVDTRATAGARFVLRLPRAPSRRA